MCLISVIIPTYNRANFVPCAIDSVINQNYKNMEIIVVDDGSTDGTKDVLSKYGNKIKYIYQINKGASAARNVGIKVARGKYIAFLDSDDVWGEGKIEAQLNDIKQFPEAVLYCTNMYFHKNGKKSVELFNICKIKNTGKSEYVEHALFNCTIVSTPSVLVKKSALLKVGFFDEKKTASEDQDLWYRIYTVGGIVLNPKVLVNVYRRDEDKNLNLSNEYLRNKKKYLETWVSISQNLLNFRLTRNQKKSAKELLSSSWFDLGLYYHDCNEKKLASKCFKKSVLSNMRIKAVVKFVVVTLCKNGVCYIKKRRAREKGFRRSEY